MSCVVAACLGPMLVGCTVYMYAKRVRRDAVHGYPLSYKASLLLFKCLRPTPSRKTTVIFSAHGASKPSHPMAYGILKAGGQLAVSVFGDRRLVASKFKKPQGEKHRKRSPDRYAIGSTVAVGRRIDANISQHRLVSGLLDWPCQIENFHFVFILWRQNIALYSVAISL